MTTTSGESVQQPGRAVRLIFEYDGDEVTLVSQQQVDVAVTGFDMRPRRVLAPGDYVEVRGAQGAPLADVAVRGALGRSLEVFPEEPGAPITRTDVERPRGAFTVVVPAGPAAQEVAVVRVAPGEEDAAAPGERAAPTRSDLATFALEPES